MSINPYRSPVPTLENVPKRTRTRWRIVFVTLFFILGLLITVGSGVPFLVGVYFDNTMSLALAAGGCSMLVSGLLWIASSILCWRGKWLATIGLVALAAVSYLVAGNLFQHPY